jgi:hypothetical protein
MCRDDHEILLLKNIDQFGEKKYVKCFDKDVCLISSVGHGASCL